MEGFTPLLSLLPVSLCKKLGKQMGATRRAKDVRNNSSQWDSHCLETATSLQRHLHHRDPPPLGLTGLQAPRFWSRMVAACSIQKEQQKVLQRSQEA